MFMTHLHLYQQLCSSRRTSMQVSHGGKELIMADCTLCRGSFSISTQALGNQCGSPMNGMFRADCTDSQTVFRTASLPRSPCLIRRCGTAGSDADCDSRLLKALQQEHICVRTCDIASMFPQFTSHKASALL